MPGHRDIVVDTSELAHKLNDVSSSVDETTSEVSRTNSSVQRMSAMVCAAEAAAAESVSKNVTSGFRNLIAVQMAQRKIECHSEIQAKCLLLQSFNDMLAQLSKQLQGDYERITKRYSKILQQLADALKTRIYNLDAPAAEVADQGYHEMINRTLSNGAAVVMVDQDVQSLSGMIATARCKEDCRKSMERLKSMVVDIRQLRDDLNKAVRDIPLDNSCRRSLPVIFFEHDDLNVADYRKTEIEVGDRAEQQRISKLVEAEYARQSENFCWRDGGANSAAVSNRILGLASQADLDDRRRGIIRDLVNRSRWQELEATE